ncbi:histidine--tRNA ligase [Fibrobacterota bacterium]
MTVQTPKGTRDFYPDAMRIQNHIFRIWRDTCLAFGYEEYEAPLFEHLELYTEKSGEEILSQLYHFKDKGGRDLALRPEITPTVARMVNRKGPSLKLPIRWFSIPRLFRYERSQKGRLREFFQLNMDIIGCGGIWAEIDLIIAVIEMLKAFGLSQQDFYVGISSRRLLTGMLKDLQVPEHKMQKIYAAMDKKGKVPDDVWENMLLDCGLSAEGINRLRLFFGCSSLDSLIEQGKWGMMPPGLEELKQLFHRLEELGYESCVRLDLSVVRGLDYYTGVVFEVFDRKKKLRAIAGGGRYDDLLEHLGGRPVSGVGFGIGDVVLLEMLKQKNLVPNASGLLDYFLVSFGDISTDMLALAGKLRKRGRRVTYSLQPGKVKKQLALANELGAGRVIFFGSDKAGEGTFEVKDMLKGEQRVVALEDL